MFPSVSPRQELASRSARVNAESTPAISATDPRANAAGLAAPVPLDRAARMDAAAGFSAAAAAAFAPATRFDGLNLGQGRTPLHMRANFGPGQETTSAPALSLARGLTRFVDANGGVAQAERAQPPIGERIAVGSRAFRGQSTRHGPAGGRLACAFAVNQILRRQGIAPIGTNPNYVPSMESDLRARVRAGSAVAVAPGQARPGDIVISSNQSHVGIAMGEGRVLSNSSSRARFSWESGMNFDGHYGSGASRIYRLLERQ